MNYQQNNEKPNLSKIHTYSKMKTNYLIERSINRRRERIEIFLREAAAADVTPNFAVTIAWHALQTAGDRRDGHILGMQAAKRQEHLMRKIRTLAKQLGFLAVYVWVTSVGAKMGDHLHMALHWRYSAFLDLVNLLQQILGSDVDHEAEVNRPNVARSCCRGWEIKEIVCGLSGALRWGRYMASQQLKHQDSTGGRRMGTSLSL